MSLLRSGFKEYLKVVVIAPLHCWFWDVGAKPERDGWWRILAAAGLRAAIGVAHAVLEVDSCWRGMTCFPGRVGLRS